MRADKFFSERFGSRTKAAEAIENGFVLVNGKTILPKTEIQESDSITFLQDKPQFVSNGGAKLQRALDTFPIDCKGKIFVDIGASTGGFTDCLLQHGAAKVYAVDVGESLLHADLLKRTEIVVMDNTNARYLQKTDFADTIDGVVTDVSFISLRLIFPVIREILSENGDAVVLVKPQFECENKHIGKSGIVSHDAHAAIVKKVLDFLFENGLYPHGITNAPVRKGKNIEYVLWIKKEPKFAKSKDEIVGEVKRIVKLQTLHELK